MKLESKISLGVAYEQILEGLQVDDCGKCHNRAV